MTCRRMPACLMALLFAAGAALAQKPPPPPTPPWTHFVRTKGHANEIPAQWIETPEGRFAHDIVLPDAIPKTVRFDFVEAQKKARQWRGKSVSRQYWEHLCATEAGNFILKPVDNVDGFYFMRKIVGLGDDANNDRWGNEAPGMQSNAPTIYHADQHAWAFVDPPSATYSWVDLPSESGGLVQLYGKPGAGLRLPRKPITQSSAAYGVTWRGIHRIRDRQELISGMEWLVLDLRSGEVLAVLRDFYITGFTKNWTDGVFWLNAVRCPAMTAIFGSVGDTAEAGRWVPTILRPSLYPGLLKFLDEKRRGER